MNILYCLDSGYLNKVKVSVASLLDHNRENFEELNIYFRFYDFEKCYQEELESIAKKYDFSTSRLHFFGADELENFLEGAGLASFKGNFIVYYKIFGLLDLGIKDRVLVIDGDTLILQDLKTLYEMDLHGKTVGAVKEFSTSSNKHGENGSKEYNTGVLLVDLNRYRDLKIEEKLLEYVSFMPSDWKTGDQTLISLALTEHQEIYQISLRYNFIQSQMAFSADEFYDLREMSEEEYYAKEEYEQAKKNPIILHLINGIFVISPWYKEGTKEIKSLWKKYDSANEEISLDKSMKRYVLIAKILKTILPRKMFLKIAKNKLG